jgi:SNF2 family DNA or RNA helicase
MKEKLRIQQMGEPITAVNAAAKLSKLLQICCGSVHTDVDTYASLDTAPRLKATKEAIDEDNAKVIVFVPYTGALWQVAKFLEQYYTVGVINGSVTGGKRTAVLNAFTREPNPHVLVANPDTASHGLNLMVADTMIWFSPIHSLDIYRQACERMARPGQKNHMRVVHMGCSALEWGVSKVLQGKDDQQQSLLDLYKQELKTVDTI